MLLLSGNEKLLFAFVYACSFDLSAFGRFYLIYQYPPPTVNLTNMACRPSFYAFSRLSFIPKRSFTSAHRPTQRSASRKRFYALLGLSLSLPAGYYFFQSSPSLSPSVYSDQGLKSSKLLTPFHKLVTIKIPSSSHAFFDRPYRLDGEMADVEGGEVVIQHIMVKSPDIQIERPYTLINDPTVANGEREMRMVVKRVRGGEVGR